MEINVDSEKMVTERSRAIQSWYPYGFILLVAIIFFSPFFFQGKIFIAADTLAGFYPWKASAPANFRPHNTLITDPMNSTYSALYNEQLKSGGLAQWNPTIEAGLPSTGVTAMSGMPGRWYPLKLLLHRFLSFPNALMMLLFIHVLLMGISMSAYLTEIGAGRHGALLGAVAYMFNGCAMVWLEFESVVATAAFFPFLFLIMERYLSPRRLYYAFLGAIVLGVVALMGQLQYVIYTAFMMLFYLAFLLFRMLKNRAGKKDVALLLLCFAITSMGGFLLSGIELLPSLDTIANSSRIGRTFTFQNFFYHLGNIPFRYFITMIFPDFFGNPVFSTNFIPSLPSQEYMNYNELCIYAGVPTLVAVIGLICASKDTFAKFYLFMIILLISMLAGTITYYPFFKLFPGMNRMNPTRLIFLLNFVFSVGAGLGIRGLASLSGKRNILFFLGMLLFVIGSVTIGFTAAGSTVTSWFNRELAYNPYTISAIGSMRRISSPIMYKPLIILLLAALLASFYALFRREAVRTLLIIGFAGLLAYDLITFGWGYNTMVPREAIYPLTPAIDFLKKQPAPFRVLQDANSGLYVNTLAPYGLEEVGGYSSFTPGRVNKLMSFIEMGSSCFYGAGFDRWITFKNINSPLFDLLNVKYILTAPNVALNNPKFKLVFHNDLAVYENTAALPRVFTAHRAVQFNEINDILAYMGSENFDMRREVVLEEPTPPGFLPFTPVAKFHDKIRIEKYAADTVDITAEMSANGWLVVTDTWYPGWHAFVDGKETPLLRADANFRAVPLVAGLHSVNFVFSPACFRNGMAMSIAGLLFVGSGFAYLFLLAGKRRLESSAGNNRTESAMKNESV